MSTLIVYASTHGFTEMCAHRLAQQISGAVDIVDLSTHPHPELDNHAIIVVGGSIHMGLIQPIVGAFCERERDALLRRPLALFLCCMKRGEEAAQQFDNAFPLRLRAHAFARAELGGAFYLDRMSILQRWVVRKLAGTTDSVEDLHEEALADFTTLISQRVQDLARTERSGVASLPRRALSLPQPQAPASHD